MMTSVTARQPEADDPGGTGVLDEPATDAASASGDAGDAGSRWSANTVVAVLLGIVGLRVGLTPLHDNSFFTHLATGRIILDTHAIPRVDPYSFSAAGEPWTVQSWGASVIYAGIERAFGLLGIRVLVATCTTLLALLVWRLTRPANHLVGRLLLAVPAIAVGTSYWVERPLLFGLLFLGVVLLALEDQLDPRWMIPVMALWVNVHGSFPLGLAAASAFAFGRWLDRERPTRELKVLGWACLGTAIGGLGPLGWRLLVFPLELLSNREAFSSIVEWQSPSWTSWGERFFALQLLLAAVLLVTRGRSWRNAIPLLLFAAASIQSMRNIVQASLVLLPGMAVAARGLGSIDGRPALRLAKPLVAALGALGILVAAAGLAGPDEDLGSYPTEAAAQLVDRGLLSTESRLVTRDFVGNYLEVRYGPDEVRVFMDDRVDMYPVSVIRDYSTLLDEGGDYAAVLARAEATAVLWDRDSDFGRWLEAGNGWTLVYSDEDWLAAVPADPA